jgi:hypothetical protein
MRAWGALLVAGCLVARRADALLCPAGLPRGPLRAFAPCQRREPCVRAAEGSIADADGAVGVQKDKYEMRKRQVAYMVHQLARIGAGCCAFGCVRACKRASERASVPFACLPQAQVTSEHALRVRLQQIWTLWARTAMECVSSRNLVSGSTRCSKT